MAGTAKVGQTNVSVHTEADSASETAGREADFLRLMRQFEPALWRLVQVYTPKPADRDDLFQEIALALWRALPRFRGESSERTWLYRIAHNVALSGQVRRSKQDKRTSPVEPAMDWPSGQPHPEQQALDQERRALLVALVVALPPADRQILLLHLEGLSDAEVGEISGLSPGAVATRLSRVRSRIGEKFRAMGVAR
jgi:RNA polymerase sigma-70 factor, ECF subfamily